MLWRVFMYVAWRGDWLGQARVAQRSGGGATSTARALSSNVIRGVFAVFARTFSFVTINSIRKEHLGRSRSARNLCLPPSMRLLDTVRMKCQYRCIWNKEIVFNSQKLVKRRQGSWLRLDHYRRPSLTTRIPSQNITAYYNRIKNYLQDCILINIRRQFVVDLDRGCLTTDGYRDGTC